jgi:hypothetical protein
MSEQSPKQVLDNLNMQSAIVVALCASPLFFLFLFLGDPGRGRAAAVCAFVIMMSAKIYWSLKRHFLFWVALLIATLLQIPLAFLNPWGNESYTGVVLLPLALVDLAVVCGILKLVEKTTTARGPQSPTRTNPET